MNKEINHAKQWGLKNNRLREQLTNENKAYYEKLLLYIRTAGIFYEEEEVEQLLYAILSDIVMAQENNEATVDYFGENPKEMANLIILRLEKPKFKKKLTIAGNIFLISSFFYLIGNFSMAKVNFNPILFFLQGILSFIVVYFTFFYIHKKVYSNDFPTKKSLLLNTFYLGLISCCVIGSFILIDLVTPPNLIVTISNPFHFILFGILTIVGASYIGLKKLNK
ncbi:hypothetical protein CKN80_09770 [Carnobacterium divergens]|uniref:hypothetical protein n=1 Tax=Carnobacterium divergens TaxID=2748 RepID=UPI0010727832|nr:hypothetical protein [Carnobacterium divergens]TFJ42855.1 hypothetical protein CKN79_09765 [Carnobacterium divergens]TFJ50007.1 hypothetical protein CKN80_09770 [Carnobacterium divergens]